MNTPAQKHIVWHQGAVKREDRNALNGHGSGLIWLTGLSASGKSTIAHAVEQRLFEMGIRSYVLDGDNVRHGLNSNLGFTPEDREENLRRVAEVGRMFVDAGILVLAAFISPFQKDRDYVRNCFDVDDFAEVYVKCSLAECEHRDPKGLYKKARAGIIKNYTGVSSPYEEPIAPDLVVDTETADTSQSVDLVISLLEARAKLNLRHGS